MKKLFILFPLTIAVISAHTQPTMQQQLEDSLIGWKTIYSFKGKQYKPLVVDGFSYSAYQQSLRDSFITWMQRTYVPIGGFGDIYQKNYAIWQKKGPVPKGIGMDALIYGMFRNERTGKYEMITNEDHNDVSIYTNALAGINPTLFFNTAQDFFFCMPKQNYESTFNDPEVIKALKDYGLHDDKRFTKYMVYFPSKSWVTVVLVPGNKLPIVQLTKGEVLVQCEKGILRELAERKDLDEKLRAQCIKNLNAMKEKYKNKLNEPAVLYGWSGPSLTDFSSTSSLPTLFIEDWYQNLPGYPVYRYSKEAFENSKKDKPLWISVTWNCQLPNTRTKAYEVHRAMVRYFNYDYVYDYFFNPEKVKGQPYTIYNSAEQAARIQQLKKHYAVTNNKPLPEGTFFMDDFSGNSDGARPVGWNDTKGRAPATIVTLNAKPGKWVQLGHMNDLSPSTSLKKPLPENFTLEFDVVTDEFNVRSGGSVKVSLSSYPTNAEGWVVPNSKGTILEWMITAGNEADYNNNNFRGESRPVITSTIAGYDGSYTYNYSPREFTNKKTSLHATVTVKNGQAIFLINGKKIATSPEFKQDYCKDCVCKGIPPSTAFRKLTFTNTTQNWSPDGKSNEVHVYISNIKITKE